MPDCSYELMIGMFMRMLTNMNRAHKSVCDATYRTVKDASQIPAAHALLAEGKAAGGGKKAAPLAGKKKAGGRGAKRPAEEFAVSGTQPSEPRDSHHHARAAAVRANQQIAKIAADAEQGSPPEPEFEPAAAAASSSKRQKSQYESHTNSCRCSGLCCTYTNLFAAFCTALPLLPKYGADTDKEMKNLLGFKPTSTEKYYLASKDQLHPTAVISILADSGTRLPYSFDDDQVVVPQVVPHCMLFHTA